MNEIKKMITSLEEDLKSVGNNYDYYSTSVNSRDLEHLEERMIIRLIKVLELIQENNE